MEVTCEFEMLAAFRLLAVCFLILVVMGIPIAVGRSPNHAGFIASTWGRPNPTKTAVGFGQTELQPPQLIPNVRIVWYLSNGMNLVLITHDGNYTAVARFGLTFVLLTVYSFDTRTNSTGWATLTYTSTTGCVLGYLLGADMYDPVNHLPGALFRCA